MRAVIANASAKSDWATSSLKFSTTEFLGAVEASHKVHLIATFGELTCCDGGDRVSSILAEPKFQSFDFVPVRDCSRVIGLLELRKLATEFENGKPDPDLCARTAMRSLDDDVLITADVDLLSFIATLDKQQGRLVLRGSQIDGIVTLSDIQKLPVRTLLFTLITHLELLMAELLRHKYSGDDALKLLNAKRREKVEERWSKLRDADLALDIFGAFEFADKKEAVLSLDFPNISRTKLKKQLGGASRLRDSVAHAGDYALTRRNALKTVERTGWVGGLIDQIDDFLKEKD